MIGTNGQRVKTRRRKRGRDFRISTKAVGTVQDGLIADMRGKLVDDRRVPWESVRDTVESFIRSAGVRTHIELALFEIDELIADAESVDIPQLPKVLRPKNFYFMFKEFAELFCKGFCQKQVQNFLKISRFPNGFHGQLVQTDKREDSLGEFWGVSNLSIKGRFPSITGWADILVFNPRTPSAEVVCHDGYRFATANSIYLLMEGHQRPRQVKFISVVLCALAYDLALKDFYHDEFGISIS